MKLRVNGSVALVKTVAFIGTVMLGSQGHFATALASQPASQISPPPTMNAALGARHIRTCSELTHQPNAAEAGALIQCGQEKEDRDGDYLFANLQVRFGAPRAYIYNQDSHLNNIDTALKLYPIRVTGDWYGCHGGRGCTVQHFSNVDGACWKTTFGDWNCWTAQAINTAIPTKRQVPDPQRTSRLTDLPVRKPTAAALALLSGRSRVAA